MQRGRMGLRQRQSWLHAETRMRLLAHVSDVGLTPIFFNVRLIDPCYVL